MGKDSYRGGSTIIGPRSPGWFGSGSPTMQAASSKQGKPLTGKPKRKSGKPSKAGLPSRTGNGLTIPDQIAKARKRIESVEADIIKTKRRLTDLDRQLAEAKRQLDVAENLPRRSAIGGALAKASEPAT